MKIDDILFTPLSYVYPEKEPLAGGVMDGEDIDDINVSYLTCFLSFSYLYKAPPDWLYGSNNGLTCVEAVRANFFITPTSRCRS